jgi:hypothetical protein
MKNLVTYLWNLNIELIGLLKLPIQTLMMLASLRKLQINELEKI